MQNDINTNEYNLKIIFNSIKSCQNISRINDIFTIEKKCFTYLLNSIRVH